jgi:hypothetical protein
VCICVCTQTCGCACFTCSPALYAHIIFVYTAHVCMCLYTHARTRADACATRLARTHNICVRYASRYCTHNVSIFVCGCIENSWLCMHWLSVRVCVRAHARINANGGEVGVTIAGLGVPISGLCVPISGLCVAMPTAKRLASQYRAFEDLKRRSADIRPLRTLSKDSAIP